MPTGRRLIILSILLILAGIGSYFLSDPKTYDATANYKVSHFTEGKWQSAVVSGADLNAENPTDKALSQMVSVALIGGGVLLLGFQLLRFKRRLH